MENGYVFVFEQQYQCHIRVEFPDIDTNFT